MSLSQSGEMYHTQGQRNLGHRVASMSLAQSGEMNHVVRDRRERLDLASMSFAQLGEMYHHRDLVGLLGNPASMSLAQLGEMYPLRPACPRRTCACFNVARPIERDVPAPFPATLTSVQGLQCRSPNRARCTHNSRTKIKSIPILQCRSPNRARCTPSFRSALIRLLPKAAMREPPNPPKISISASTISAPKQQANYSVTPSANPLAFGL